MATKALGEEWHAFFQDEHANRQGGQGLLHNHLVCLDQVILATQFTLVDFFPPKCRDNLKINVRESAEMDQADLELRATIMKVLRCTNNYLDPSTNKEKQSQTSS